MFINMTEEKFKFRIRKPNDFHHHLRENELLPLTTKHCFDKFHHVIVMPNLEKPIISIKQALEYRKKIRELDRRGNPLMTLYLHQDITNDDLLDFKNHPELIGIKYYPFGITTNSQHGGCGNGLIERMYPIIKVMEKEGIPLLIHGENISPKVDIFDREKVFLTDELTNLIEKFPNLKIILEHITTIEAVKFVLDNDIYATITPHHLTIDRNAMFKNGINPHLFCKPILQRMQDRQALITAAFSGKRNFFLGTDSAPHIESKKLTSCGCAGIFNSPVAVEQLIQLSEDFMEKPNLNNLEKFMSTNGCDCYNLPYNEDFIEISQTNWKVPEKYGEVVPFLAGSNMKYKYE